MLPLRLVASARTFLLLFFFVAALLGGARAARADDGAVLLRVLGDELPRERLRDRLADELGRPVALSGPEDTGREAPAGGVVTVTYRRSSRELAVTWDGPKRGTVSRVVSAPPDVDGVVRDAAMLAGNLARDEADELYAPPPLPAANDEATPAPPRPAPPPPEASAPAPRETRASKDQDDVTAGLFYPLATNMARPWARTRFDLNLLHGRVGQLDGFQLGGVNVVARAGGRGTGDVNGIQLATLANVATGQVGGLQLASAVNVAGAGLEGWQTALAVNRAGGDVTGVQTALGLNTTSGRMTGLQLASLNVAGDVAGAQIGVINVGRNVSGAMIGLVNVADDVDGVPIGLASVSKSGGVHPQAWTSTATYANLGIKLATKHTYTMPSAHYHRAYDRDFAGAGFTIGGHIPLRGDRLGPYVDTDLSFAFLYAPERSAQRLPSGLVDTYHEHLVQPRVRAIFGWRFVEHFGLFAGASVLLQARVLRDGDEAVLRVGPEFVAGVEL
ncbi:MAG: hypothetical protein KF782_15905 [Labilithrix sp.]|nr:hypothetical protein [Labilithrix sp.]